jgi:hypothetical protein
MFVAVIGVIHSMVFDPMLSRFSFLSGYSVRSTGRVFEQYLVTVVEDTRIVLVVMLPTSLRTTR